MIDKRNLNESDSKVPSAVYFEFSDKLGFITNQLNNLLGDHADKAVSYKKFRYEANKRNIELDLGLEPLEEEVNRVLNILNTNRNWSLHIPESLVNTEFEVRNRIAESTGIEMKFNPIYNAYHLYHDGRFFTSLLEENTEGRKMYISVFSQMKKDYSVLIGEKVELKWVEYGIRPLEDLMNVEMSAQVQHKKYEGVDSNKLSELTNRMILELIK